MCFFNVVFQSDAEISILAAEAHLLRSEHFYVLHRNFCYPIRAAVQFLFFGGEAVDVKVIAKLRLRNGRRRRFDQFKRFWFGMQLEFSGFWLLNDRRTRSGRNLGGFRYWLRRYWALRCGRRLGCYSADQVGELSLHRRPRAGLHRHSHKS